MFSKLKSPLLYTFFFTSLSILDDHSKLSTSLLKLYTTTNDNKLYLFGQYIKNTNSYMPVLQDLPDGKLIDISIGPDYNIIILENGIYLNKVTNKKIEGEKENKYIEVKEFSKLNIISSACNNNHFYLLSKNGNVYELPLDIFNNYNYNLNKSYLIPLLIDNSNNNVYKIVANNNNIAILTKNGQVFTKGDNTYGQCGQRSDLKLCELNKVYTSSSQLSIEEFPETNKTIQVKPKSPPIPMHPSMPFASPIVPSPDLAPADKATVPLPPNNTDPVIDVAIGTSHLIMVTKTGSVYTCGHDSQLQLAQGEPWRVGYEYRSVPSKVKFLDGIKAVRATAGTAHSAVIVDLNDRTDVISWGQGIYGQLGLASPAHVSFPRMIETFHGLRFFEEKSKVEKSLSVVQLASGDNHMLALLNDGTVFTWGLNKNGQCGSGSRANLMTPTILKLDKDTSSSKSFNKVRAGYNRSGVML